MAIEFGSSQQESKPKPLDFGQVFDGRQPVLSEQEKLSAAIAFKERVQDIFLTNMDRVARLNGAAALYPTDYSRLDLAVSAEDGTTIGVTAKSFDTGTVRTTPYTLDLFERVPFGQPFKHVLYELAPDGSEVTRRDMSHDAVKKFTKSAPDLDTPTEHVLKDLAKILEEGLKNRELERQMGLNDQPVDIDEIQKLAELIADAKPSM